MYVELETYDARAHITAIEINNRLLKERIKCVRFNIPFAKLPRDFLIKVVLQTVTLMNSLPRKDGVHPT